MMTRSTPRCAIWLAACSLMLMTLPSRTVSGEPTATTNVVQIGGTPSLVINGVVDTVEIPVSREVMPMLYFIAPVSEAKPMVGDGKLVGAALVREQNVVMMYPRRRLRPGEMPTVRVKAKGYDAFLRLREAAAGERVEPAYRVWHRTEQEALQALIDSKVETKTEERDAKRQASYDEQVQKAATEQFVRMMREHRNRIPAKVKTDGGDVILGVDVATWLKDDVYLLIPVHNTSHRPFKPKAPHVFDERGERYEAELIDPGPYGVGDEIDESGEAGDDVVDVVDEHEALIPGYTETSVVVHISDVGGARFDRLRLVFDQVDGLPSAWAEVEEWPNPFMRPKSAREVEIETAARQVAVALRLLTGAFWFSDGAGLGREKATSMLGLGAYLQKGFGNGLALGAEIQLARTGDARFDDVVVAGSTGDLTRNAAVGRLILGGSAGFGYPTQIALRLGLGVQGASNSATFNANGASMEGPGASLEWTSFLVFGASVRRRLGENVVIGVQATVTEPLNADDKLFRRSMEIGAHLGVGWSLAEPEPPADR